MNLKVILASLFVLSVPLVAYTTLDLEAKTLTVETPVGITKVEIPNNTPTIKLEAEVPQDMNWSVAPTPKAKPTYVHKAKKTHKDTKANVHTHSNNNSDWINFPHIVLPEVKF